MPNLNLRLTEELHATLKAAAAKNHRSLQNEIVHRLEEPERVEAQGREMIRLAKELGIDLSPGVRS